MLEQVVDAAWDDASTRWVAHVTLQSEGLAGAGLTIGEHGAVVALQSLGHNGYDALREQLALGGALVKHTVEQVGLALHIGGILRHLHLIGIKSWTRASHVNDTQHNKHKALGLGTHLVASASDGGLGTQVTFPGKQGAASQHHLHVDTIAEVFQ